MKRGKWLSIPLLLTLLLPPAGLALPRNTQAGAAPQTVQAPVLKWQRGGCFPSWCPQGWYSSPAVADLDGDGTVEVIGSAYSIAVLDGPTGALEWRVRSGHDRTYAGTDDVGRTWPGIVAADVDADGEIEIVAAHAGGYVSVYTHDGYFQAGWPQRPTTSELRGLSVYDLDGDGQMEILVTAAIGDPISAWVYEPDGTLRPGWPQLTGDSGYQFGVYNANAAVGDLNGDGQGEIVVPSDTICISAYDDGGVQIPANPVYGTKAWGKVGTWESLATELRGWGQCNTSYGRGERNRPRFASGPAAIADMDGNGSREAVAVGDVYDCATPEQYSLYNGPYIFNADRSRFTGSGYDWSSTPIDTGAPLTTTGGVIEAAMPNPAIADLDGDGRQELLYASYDGRLHAFWLDKTEHGNWPYAVYTGGLYRYASEPVVADLDADGHAEVIFASWVQKDAGATGKLHILDHLGSPLQTVDLPPAFGILTWNGALAAPTLANLDADADLEVVLNTAASGLVAYDLPGTANARVLWRTGRGNYQRTGSPIVYAVYLPVAVKGP